MLNKNKPFSLQLDPDMLRPATAEEKEYISKMRPSSTFFKDGVKRLLKNKVRSIGTTDLVICFNHECALDNALLGLNYILFAQNLALKKSLSLSIGPDNLCPTGEVNRVVKGVTIYPYQK